MSTILHFSLQIVRQWVFCIAVTCHDNHSTLTLVLVMTSMQSAELYSTTLKWERMTTFALIIHMQAFRRTSRSPCSCHNFTLSVRAHAHTRARKGVYMCVHACVYVRMCVCLCLCMHVCVCVCVCVLGGGGGERGGGVEFLFPSSKRTRKWCRNVYNC